MNVMLRIIIALTASLIAPVSIIFILGYLFPQIWGGFNGVGLMFLFIFASPITFVLSYIISKRWI